MKRIAAILILMALAGCQGGKNILLSGDSVSLFYTPFVQMLDPMDNIEHASGCDVPYGKRENGQTSTKQARCMKIWLSYKTYSIVHFNAGLWDIRDCGNGPQTALSDYINNLQTIIDAIRASGAIPIFATTTPVLNVQNGVYSCYHNSDVIKYNAAAVELMNSEGIQVDDEYSRMYPLQNKYHLPQNIHFTDEGSEFLAQGVTLSLFHAH